MMTGPIVDTPSALEFQREIMDRISEAELQDIAADLDRKSVALRDLLSGEPSLLDRATLRQVLRWVFATRRRADQILDSIGPQPLATAIAGLLAAGDPVADRIDRFDGALTGRAAVTALAGSSFDLPAELLHFTSPDQYWLWTRWMWDPDARTGALALVTTDDVDLSAGATRGAVYLTVGRAMAFVDETGKAAGFTAAGPGLFGADVFLAAMYGVYMYTILRMRMTREFNRVVPPLAHLVRHLLGVCYLEG
jgi:uncharacterized protein YqcC (DUF446 family)